MNYLKKMAMMIALLLTAACGRVENEFTSAPCYLVIDNSLHQDATLATAMNALSPGIFCSIRHEVKTGADHFVFKNNQGAESSKKYNAIDMRRTYVIGMNNGLIVGFGNLDNPPIFYAYDNQCPNCFDPHAIPVRNYPLGMDANGIATCNTCKRKYNMNTGGNIVEGNSGSKLTRYRASTGGPLGVLGVN